MINDHNLDQAIRQTATPAPKDFRSTIPQPDLDSQKRYLDSTHRTAFINHFPQTSPPHRHGAGASTSLTLVPAGGAGGRNVERGKAVSGAMGEVFRVSAEPQRDTHAQRSWMYSKDPMITVMHQKAANQPSPATRETQPEASAKPEHFRRQSTSITTIPLAHKGVFVDD